MAVKELTSTLVEEQDDSWRKLAEERAAALTDLETKRVLAERQRQSWMKTAQMAEEWADQLNKVRLWLQEQLLVQSKELDAARHEKEQALAELTALRAQCQAAATALAQKHEQLSQVEGQLRSIEHSRGLRLLRWMRRRLLPPHSLRGKVASKSFNVTVRLLRRGSTAA